MEAISGGLRNGILNLTLKEANELYECYMPFIAGGGLFIPTRKQYMLGDEVFVLLELMEEPDKIPLTGKIVWVTPKGVSGSRRSGVGIQFPESNADLINKIETYLAGLLQSARPTHTL